VLKQIIDEASSTLTYVCEAAPGTASSAAAWRVQRISVSGAVTTISYAGTGAFDQIADETYRTLAVRLTTLLGDWPLDRSAGVDWIRIFGQKPVDAEEVSALLVIEIIDTPGVSAVQDVAVTTEGDALTFTAVVLTEDEERLQVVVEPFGADGNPSVVVGGLLGGSGRIIHA
jgi:hypothetical protein